MPKAFIISRRSTHHYNKDFYREGDDEDITGEEKIRDNQADSQVHLVRGEEENDETPRHLKCYSGRITRREEMVVKSGSCCVFSEGSRVHTEATPALGLLRKLCAAGQQKATPCDVENQNDQVEPNPLTAPKGPGDPDVTYYTTARGSLLELRGSPEHELRCPSPGQFWVKHLDLSSSNKTKDARRAILFRDEEKVGRLCSGTKSADVDTNNNSSAGSDDSGENRKENMIGKCSDNVHTPSLQLSNTSSMHEFNPFSRHELTCARDNIQYLRQNCSSSGLPYFSNVNVIVAHNSSSHCLTDSCYSRPDPKTAVTQDLNGNDRPTHFNSSHRMSDPPDHVKESFPHQSPPFESRQRLDQNSHPFSAFRSTVKSVQPNSSSSSLSLQSLSSLSSSSSPLSSSPLPKPSPISQIGGNRQNSSRHYSKLSPLTTVRDLTGSKEMDAEKRFHINRSISHPIEKVIASEAGGPTNAVTIGQDERNTLQTGVMVSPERGGTADSAGQIKASAWWDGRGIQARTGVDQDYGIISGAETAGDRDRHHNLLRTHHRRSPTAASADCHLVTESNLSVTGAEIPEVKRLDVLEIPSGRQGSTCTAFYSKETIGGESTAGDVQMSHGPQRGGVGSPEIHRRDVLVRHPALGAATSDNTELSPTMSTHLTRPTSLVERRNIQTHTHLVPSGSSCMPWSSGIHGSAMPQTKTSTDVPTVKMPVNNPSQRSPSIAKTPSVSHTPFDICQTDASMSRYRKHRGPMRKKRSFMIASLIGSDNDSSSDDDNLNNISPNKRPTLCDSLSEDHNLNNAEKKNSEEVQMKLIKPDVQNFPTDVKSNSIIKKAFYQRPNSLPLQTSERESVHVRKVDVHLKSLPSKTDEASSLNRKLASLNSHKPSENQTETNSLRRNHTTIDDKNENPSNFTSTNDQHNSNIIHKGQPDYRSLINLSVPHHPFPYASWPVVRIDEACYEEQGDNHNYIPNTQDLRRYHQTNSRSPKETSYSTEKTEHSVKGCPNLFQPLPLRFFPIGASFHQPLSSDLYPFSSQTVASVSKEPSEDPHKQTREYAVGRKDSMLNHFQTMAISTALNLPSHFPQANQAEGNLLGTSHLISASSDTNGANSPAVRNVTNRFGCPPSAPTFSPCGSDGVSLASSSEPGASPTPSTSLSSPCSPRPNQLPGLSPRSFMVPEGVALSTRVGGTSVSLATPGLPLSNTLTPAMVANNNSNNNTINLQSPPRVGPRYDNLQLKMGRGGGAELIEGTKSFKSFLENANVKLEFINGGNGIKNPLLSSEFAENKIGLVTGGCTLPCPVCTLTFDTAKQLQRHLKSHREIKRFLCTFCAKGFNDTFDLKRHTRTHTGVRPYKCDMCEKAFTQRCSLESHRRKIHGCVEELAFNERRVKLYVCEECGHSTDLAEEHYTHMRHSHAGRVGVGLGLVDAEGRGGGRG